MRRAGRLRGPWLRRTIGGPRSRPRPFGPQVGTSCAWYERRLRVFYFRSILTASPQWSVTVVAPEDCEM
jgi:hypothetical protein